MKDWDTYFVEMAELVSTKSKDPSTKVGAVIVGPGNEIVSTGFNGFPRGVREHEIKLVDPFQGIMVLDKERLDKERWEKRPEKYQWVEHAERNAIFNAARYGIKTEGCRMYLNWLPIPCSDCTRAIIQAGIVEIIGPTRPFTGKGEGAHYHCGEIEQTMLNESGVTIREVTVSGISV